MKARAIPYPHQPLSRGDNTVSVAQGGTATPGTTKQLLLPDRVFKRIIYIAVVMSRTILPRRNRRCALSATSTRKPEEEKDARGVTYFMEENMIAHVKW